MDYEWKANFNDATSLSQFDGDVEVPFSEVEDRFDDLISFELVGADDVYAVDLTNGLITHDGNVIDTTFEGKSGLGIVYKRRNKIRLNSFGEQLDARTTFLLGLTDGVDDAVVHVFPGLEMVEPKIEIKYKEGKKEKKDITELIKNKEL